MLLPQAKRNIDRAGPIGCDAPWVHAVQKNDRTAKRPGHFSAHGSVCKGQRPQVEYLNSGIAFSSSLVALKTAWSGHQGFGFDAAGAVAAPVVVVPPGLDEPLAPLAGGAFDAPV